MKIKKIYSLIMVVIGAAILLTGCDEGIDLNEDAIYAAKPTVKVNPDFNFFNLLDPSNTKIQFELGVDSLTSSEVSQIKLKLAFTGADTTYTARELSTVNTFPSTIDLTLIEALDLFPDLSVDDLEAGDSFDFSMEITTAAGQTFTRVSQRLNVNQTPNGDYTPSFPLACPSDIPVEGKTYKVENTVEVPFPCCGLTAGTYTGTATITNQGQGSYLISDFGGGALAAGGVGDDPVIITDVCQEYFMNNGPSVLAYRANGNITYNSETGVFTIPYVHSSGYKGVTTLTPQ